jgi:zinc protease
MRRLSLFALVAIVGCGGATTSTNVETSGNDTPVEATPRARVEPPPSGPARDVHLPPIVRASLPNGMELDTIHTDGLPIVYVRLVLRSGTAADPANRPGLARLVVNMLKEGTRRQTSAQIAEAIEFLGADLQVEAEQESTTLVVRAMAEHLDSVIGLLAEMAMTPRFDEQELRRLKQRELDRLQVQYADPSQIAYREFYRTAYGPAHPYGHVDLTPESIRATRRQDVVAWHRDHFVPNNAILVVAGNVTPEQVHEAAERAFGSWRQRTVPPVSFPEIAPRTQREIVIVNRPGSGQSVVALGNHAIERSHTDWVPLAVANQVLGGSAMSRLFMDLREHRSLTYGAYSGVDELPHVGPFRARGSVGPDPRHPEVDRTALAMEAFVEHLHRITTEQAPQEEVAAAQRYLADSFPLQIDTAGRIAMLVADLRVYGLADDYWDTYRTQIRQVTPEQALAAARAHIHPETALVVVVGDASRFQEQLRRWGPVRVITPDGAAVATFPALPVEEAAQPPPPRTADAPAAP